jgi:cyclopropane-fatty-acyl-phospholipid synthase
MQTTKTAALAHPGMHVPEAPTAPLRAHAAEMLFRSAIRTLPLNVIGPRAEAISRGPIGAPTMSVHRPDFFHRLGADGKIGFAEAYMAGDWGADDLAAVLTVLAGRLTRLIPPAMARFRSLYEPRLPAAERNTVAGAARNVSRHYDLSNDLFGLFLDETMTYSCAVFERGDSLEQAQRRKFELMCELVELRADDHLLEIGTGWGGLAMYAAATRGCRVTTATLSTAQRELAQRRIADAGLADRIDVVLSDYRDLVGRHSTIISVEMFEAVGEQYWPTFFACCDRLLAPDGRVGLQTITMPHERYLATRRMYGWIHKYVFPGGMIPSPEAIDRSTVAGSTLRVRARTEIGPNYARTLELWRERFMANRELVLDLGFTREFARMWEFYLAYCQAGFATAALGNQQMLLTRGEHT